MEGPVELGYGNNPGFVFFRPRCDNDYRGLTPLYPVEVSQDYGGNEPADGRLCERPLRGDW